MRDEAIEGVRGCVFDAYGTLFDVNAAAARCQDRLGDNWQPLAELWRAKQLQYTWLRSLMNRHAGFWQVTQDALDFALATLKIDDDALRRELLDLYFQLDAYPEVKETLTVLKDAGLKTAILSNGSPDMLSAAVGNAGIGDLLDAVYSVESVGVFKPHPSVYRLAVDGLGLDASAMSFQSSNGWDAFAAKDYGFNVIWVNRFGQTEERIPQPPDRQIKDLSALPPLVGAG
ncbi:MAG: haloacid dehalogenase type II [Minwuia sp.]|uniref:haloacid dehalogenase type II n=1 Tax=Minwuia sp. TaxID=2493630 RepID=UPI003A836ABD